MRSDKELLNEIENANGGDGPDPIATAGPELAALAVAIMEAKASDERLDRAVADARRSGHSWQSIGDLLGMTRQGALKRYRDTTELQASNVGPAGIEPTTSTV